MVLTLTFKHESKEKHGLSFRTVTGFKEMKKYVLCFKRHSMCSISLFFRHMGYISHKNHPLYACLKKEKHV